MSYTGSACLLENKTPVAGGITWETLELEQGPGTVVGQIEAVAPASQQILVQQTPGSSSNTSLQDVLQLPGYPSSDGGYRSLPTVPLSHLFLSVWTGSLLPITVQWSVNKVRLLM